MEKIIILYRSANKVSCPNLTSVQQILMGFWLEKRPSLWAHFIMIHMFLSPLQLCSKNIFKNTPSTLCSGPIFPGRSRCQILENSPKSPKLSSCFLLHVFTKIQPRCPCFPMISVVELHDINPYFFSSLVPDFLI